MQRESMSSKSANQIQVSLSKTQQPKYHITLESLCFLNDYWVVSNARRTVPSKKTFGSSNFPFTYFHASIYNYVTIYEGREK